MTDRPTLPPEDDRDFTQLTGAFDRPVAPSPAFAERVRRQVADAQQERGAPEMHAHTVPEPRVSRITDNRVIPMPPAQRSGGSIMEIVAAALLIFALVSSGFYLYRIQNGTTPNDPDGQRLAATTPLASPTPGSDASESEDSQAYPTVFDPAAEYEVVMLDNGLSRPIYAAVSGDTLVASGNLPGADEPNEQGLMAIDLGSGEVLWTLELAPWGNFVIEGGRIVGVFELPVEGEFGMTAISLESGRVGWTGETLITYGGSELGFTLPPYQTFRPILYKDALYFAEPYGEVTALDVNTGELLWSLPLEQRVQRPGPHGGVSIDGEGKYLYAMDGESAVRKIDRQTGEVMERFELSDRNLSEFELELHVDDDLLVVIARAASMDGSYGFVEALSTRTGEHLWTRDIGNPAPYIAITSEVVVTPYHILPDNLDDAPDDITEPGFYVSFLDRTTGEPISLYRSSEPGFGTVSASADVVCINEGTAIQCVDTQSDDLPLMTMPYAPGAESYAPLLYWNDSAVVLSIDDGITLLRPGEPQASPAAVPETNATPVATDPSVARGGSFGTDASLDPTYAESELPTGPLAPTWTQEVPAPTWMMPYGNVIAVLGTSELAVYDDQTGEELWSQPVSEVLRDQLADDPGDPTFILAMHAGPMALPWVEGETLYVTTPSELVGLDLRNGEETFRTPHHSGDIGVAGSEGKLPAGLTIADNMAYVQGWPDELGQALLSAIDLTSGETLWSSDLAGMPQGAMAVVDGRIILAVANEDGDRIIALDTSDGSVAWTVEDALGDGDRGRLDGTTFFITDGTIVQTRMTTSGQEEPSGEPADALRVAAYDLDTGDVLWTSRSDDPSWGMDPDAINGCGFFPRISDGALLIPCWGLDMSSMHLISLPIDGNGTAETSEALSGLPGAITMGFVASDTTWIYGTDEEIVQLDLASGATTSMGTIGGETCDQRAFPTSNGLACLTTDGLGTYSIQVFAPESEVPATPDATPAPATSDVAPDYTGAWPTR